MKTKLSLLALPLCLGLALTLALVACGSDGPTNSTPSSSSGLPPPLSSEVSNPEVKISDDFAVSVTYEIGDIIGKIDGSGNNPITKIEFTPSGWVQTRNITLPSPSINLTGKADIDLTNSSIQCGKPQTIQVQACAEKICSSKNATFEKPAYLCEPSSSSGASSSSEAGWRFGPPTNANIDKLNDDVNIGSAGSFILRSEDNNPKDGTPDMVVTGGKVRSVVSQNLISEKNGQIPTTTYSAADLGKNVPASNVSDEPATDESYFLVYFDNGDKYLVYFERGGSRWSEWPKKCTYWKAIESPSP